MGIISTNNKGRNTGSRCHKGEPLKLKGKCLVPFIMLLVIAIHAVAINRFIHVFVYSTTCEFGPRRAPLKLYTHFEWSPTWAHLGGISWAERVPRVGSLQWWKWGKERPDLEPLTWEAEPRGRAPA